MLHKGLRKLPFLVFSLRAAALACGVLPLWRYEAKPGTAGKVPTRWPSGDRIASLPGWGPGRGYTLVVALHPHCPCSQATIRELGRVMARSGGLLRACVLVVRPAGVPAGWEQTDLWDEAAAIPGVSVACDEGGRQAMRFGAETSGLVVLYDPQGRLVFCGGITSSRGHEGDNAGSDAIVEAVRSDNASTADGLAVRAGGATTPVYGCALSGSMTRPSGRGLERCQR